MTTVGFIGAGQLGEPMVVRLLESGQQVRVFARRDDVRARLSRAGAALVESVAALAADSDVLIACLFSDAQLRETGFGPDGFIANAKRGSIIVSHTTGTVATLVELARSAPNPPAILDAPVSGTVDHIREGRLTVLIGGPDDAVDHVRPVLAAYADPVVPTGALGTALAIKLINNALFAANAQLAAVAIALGEQLAVNPDSLLAALAVSSGGSNAAAYMRGVGGAVAFAELAAPFLRKDVAAAKDAAASGGFTLGLLGSVIDAGPLQLVGDG
jgi:3-hydroxyisobutyrate dehydrogenase-like beta-hydroxyacid dehydrogenase